MTVAEAIHEQQLHLDGDPSLKDIRLRQAMHLGIEALKRVRETRKRLIPDTIILLPGETEE